MADTSSSPASSRVASQLVGSWAYGAAVASGLDSELLEQPGTVFVPSDNAIKAYVAASHTATADLVTDAGRAAVATHMVPNVRLTFGNVPEGSTTYATKAGVPVTVNNDDGILTVSCGEVTANVVKTDIVAGNAVIMIVDRVLMPV